MNKNVNAERKYSKEEYKLKAIAISTQMGGAGIMKALLGIDAYRIIETGEGGLAFKFKGNRSINYCEVKLMPNDTYTINFRRVTAKQSYHIKTFDYVHCDQLKTLFEKTTGLYLSFCS
jgi:REP element-mobilizing transposase RayT